jgi:hypothetical protein
MHIESIKELIQSWPYTDEHPHFERMAFRVKQKIFATHWPKEEYLMIVLTPIQQQVYIHAGQGHVTPVPNAWGKKGCTLFDLQHIESTLLIEALRLAYEQKSVKKNK